jgi:hypothetical protein
MAQQLNQQAVVQARRNQFPGLVVAPIPAQANALQVPGLPGADIAANQVALAGRIWGMPNYFEYGVAPLGFRAAGNVAPVAANHTIANYNLQWFDAAAPAQCDHPDVMAHQTYAICVATAAHVSARARGRGIAHAVGYITAVMPAWPENGARAIFANNEVVQVMTSVRNNLGLNVQVLDQPEQGAIGHDALMHALHGYHEECRRYFVASMAVVYLAVSGAGTVSQARIRKFLGTVTNCTGLNLTIEPETVHQAWVAIQQQVRGHLARITLLLSNLVAALGAGPEIQPLRSFMAQTRFVKLAGFTMVVSMIARLRVWDAWNELFHRYRAEYDEFVTMVNRMYANPDDAYCGLIGDNEAYKQTLIPRLVGACLLLSPDVSARNYGGYQQSTARLTQQDRDWAAQYQPFVDRAEADYAADLPAVNQLLGRALQCNTLMGNFGFAGDQQNAGGQNPPA